jgi:guanylate kinase
MKKREKLIIIGKSASGKDFLLQELSKVGLKSSAKITTRPKRDLEIEGVHYQFKTNEEFNNLSKSDRLLVSQQFINNTGDVWRYGISKDDYNENQAFIMTPNELSQISEKDRKGIFVVYLDIDKNIRESRLISRNDNNDSIRRRLDSDDVDFSQFKDYDLRITDPNFDVGLVLDLMV